MIVRQIICLCILSLAYGCSEPKLRPIPDNAKILAFGDSLTEGYGVKPDQSYPSVLERLIGITVVNAGISGETTSEGLRRIESVLDRETPNLLVLIEGGNDILRNQDLKQTEQNLSNMIKMAQAREIDVVLMGIPLKSLFSSACAPFYETLAKRHSVPLDCHAIGKLLRQNRYKSDAIHFNAEGYAMMAEKVRNLMEDEGAL